MNRIRNKKKMTNEPLYYKYWGKADNDGNRHLLVYHCLDVAAVGKVWLERSPAFVKRASNACGLSEKVFKEWFLFFLALHDIGKFDVRFQGKVPDVLKTLQPDAKKIPNTFYTQCKDYNHGEAGWAWGIYEQSVYFVEQSEAFENWHRTVSGHHGKVPQKSTIKPPAFISPVFSKRDKETRIIYVKTMKELFAPNQSLEKLPEEPSALLAGFCSVCDWIGSNAEYFTLQSDYNESQTLFENCRAYYKSQFRNAEKALKDFGVLSTAATEGGMRALFSEFTPHGVQTIIDQIPLEQSLTIIEAPTGSGKTESALAYASLLLSNGIAETITFALPTQATTNAMFPRMGKVATKMFKGEANLILAHGKSRFNESFLDIKNRNKSPKDEDCFIQCSNWLASSKKRSFLGQIGVSTIDQVLLSVLPVKHYFVRSFGIGRSVLIVDEVHAYDNYMYGLLKEVIREQKKLGGSVILLSATLPLIQKEKLLEAWGITINEEVVPKDVPYPLITSSLLEKPITVSPDEQPKPFNVSVDLYYSNRLVFNDEIISQIIKAAELGASVCVICNIVADAQLFAQKVSEKVSRSIQVDIFHSRYRYGDRKKKEDAVIEQYGEGGERKGRILIATQVVEQSLDIDFDCIITQLCPADLLFQRLGRLHRHSHERPAGFKNRKITVILPENELEYGGTGFVYQNILALWKTQRLLETNNTIVFPEAYREWIEEVYNEDTTGASRELQDLHNAFVMENDSRHFTANHLTKNRDTINAIDDRSDDAALLTRDGEMSISLIPMLNDDTLLDGTQLSKLHEWEKWEVLSQNSVPVPSSKSWQYNFAPFEDGYMKIEMREIDGVFIAENEKYRFTYTTDRGLERTEI